MKALAALPVILILLATVVTSGTVPTDSSGFAPPRIVELGDDVWSVCVADIDGNGRADIASVPYLVGEVTVFTSVGDLSFTPGIVAETSARPDRIHSGDMNADGRPDLILSVLVPTPQGTVDPLEVLIDRGDGSSKSTVYPTLSPCDTPIVLADLDADGDVDLVYSLDHRASMSGFGILLNDGTGSFTDGPWVETTSDVRRFSAGDVNGDGLPDLALILDRDGLEVCRNEGDLRFSAASQVYDYRFQAIALADVHGDSKLDLVAARDGPGSEPVGIYVFPGDGSGSFDRYVVHPNGFRGGWPVSRLMRVTDLDDDGDVDIVADAPESQVSVLLNKGDGTFGESLEYPLTAPGAEASVLGLFVADVGGDERRDLVAHLHGGRVSILLRKGEFPTERAPAPVIEDVTPGNVEAGETRVFTIEGTGFAPGVVVDFGEEDRVVDVRQVDPDRIVVTVDVAPRSDVALLDVAVTNPGGGADDLLGQAGEDMVLSLGSQEYPFQAVVAGTAPGWRISRSGRVLRYRSPPGESPRIRIAIRRRSRRPVRVSVSGMEFPGPQTGDVGLDLVLGAARATGVDRWSEGPRARFRP